jgi:endonuclease/exonuclease/phosphatase family metal-dependent hydrolase
VGVHLALGEKYRNAQLAYLSRLLKQYQHVIIMGDFNCRVDHLERSPLAELDLVLPTDPLLTYPSWAPDRHIDHILLSPSLTVTRSEVLSDCRLSDHLPVATEIVLPAEVVEAAGHAPRALPRHD